MGMKFNLKFEIWENFTKDFHVKKNYMGIPCKMNSDFFRKKGSLIFLKLGTLDNECLKKFL